MHTNRQIEMEFTYDKLAYVVRISYVMHYIRHFA